MQAENARISASHGAMAIGGASLERALAVRPTLRAWLDEYASIEREFVAVLEAQGVEFALRDVARTRAKRLLAELRGRDARFLNGGSSVSSGFLSSACRACVGDCGSATFHINFRCKKGCYFCFNPNQVDFEGRFARDAPWRERLEAFCHSVDVVTHVGLTGGEPLLAKDEMFAFFARARELAPDAHMRLYTTGDGLDESCCRELARLGLDEIRFSIKLEEGETEVARVLSAIDCAHPFIDDVMVEMPVVPGTLARMKRLLHELDERGVAGINVLEFCFPFTDWSEFGKRGMRVKNPPFPVLYDYGYAGGLPIDGSEEECLALVLYAMEENLRLGVHYCSLDNKNRDQILQMNRSLSLDSRLYELGADGFYRCAKVFDGDVAVVRSALREQGARYVEGEDEVSLTFHPSYLRAAQSAGAFVALSCNVVERRAGEPVVRELSLELLSSHEESKPDL